MSFSPISVG